MSSEVLNKMEPIGAESSDVLRRSRAEMNPGGTPPNNEGLLYSVFQQLRTKTASGVAVALTSASSGEGVTHSITALTSILSKDGSNRILRLDSRQLSETKCDPQQIAQQCQQTDLNLYEFVGDSRLDAVDADRSWHKNWEYRRDCMQELRNSFEYVLIDCPSLNSAGDVLSLAPLVDGIIMIIEADKTRIDQIQHAEKSIEFARGKLIGHVLNKRTYKIPAWLYKHL
jgi:Mrp family chromosome partitioning ATPase